MLASLFLAASAMLAATVPAQPGESYEIVRVHRSEYRTNNGSSGSSSGTDSIVERVIGRTDEGLEIEYDLPNSATAEDRAKVWQFPVRVFKPSDGQPRLLNTDELEARVDAWLKAADWPREVCGHWIFTWNAFRIDCDPQSVLKRIAAFDLRADDLQDGSSYSDDQALGAAPLRAVRSGPRGSTYQVTLQVDPEAVRRAEIESDLAVAEISRETLSPEDARLARAAERISGTITVTFETGADGHAWRRTSVAEIHIERPDGESETRTTTETLERRPVRRVVPPDTV